MRSWFGVALAMTTAAALIAPASAQNIDDIPVYEPRFLGAVPLGEGTCVPDSDYDMPDYYGDDCTRLRFVFGPILAKPGQNDVLIQPVTFEKPWYDGYMVRNKPDLVDATGAVPNVEDIHLHHGTWLNLTRNYGSGPFWASGEEKTLLPFPENYGVRILPDDQWLLLHMVHNATPIPHLVYVTYEIDFVPIEAAEQLGFENTRQIWLDVGGGSFHEDTETFMLNPIFNVQKGFGEPDELGYPGQHGFDPETGIGLDVCYFPRDNCAAFNPYGRESAQQGQDVSQEVDGKDYTVGSAALGDEDVGTLILMGGHVHPGGVRTEVEMVRNGEKRLIHMSDVLYWDHQDPTRIGAPPVSWDQSTAGNSKAIGWAVEVQRGDILRLNGVYDTSLGSWYEQMGIVMSWVVPGDDSGIDPFDENVEIVTDGFPEDALMPPGLEGQNTCVPSETTLCARGQITRPSEEARNNHQRCHPSQGCADLPDIEGPAVSEIPIQAFNYGPADFGTIWTTGIPQVKVDEPVTFTNLDAGAYIWHTVTRCQEPCTVPTSASSPLADGGSGEPNDPMDFDSSELGVGAAPAQRVEWDFTPTETGTFTFWCRIHPGMRGAFEVVE